MNTIPTTNQAVFELMYEIENGLRELIVEVLTNVDGPFWYKSRLPGDILKKYREGIAIERSVNWSRLIPHHPIYYVDFPHLREIITNGKNWDPVFRQIFIRREVFEGNFVELETIRNRLAHNRQLSPADLTIAHAAYSVFAQSLGPGRLKELAARCTKKEDLEKEIRNLRFAIEKTHAELRAVAVLSQLGLWSRLSSEWWFDDDYLGSRISAIQSFFAKGEEYNAIPRRRGVGHELEKWLEQNNVDDLYTEAHYEIEAILRLA